MSGYIEKAESMTMPVIALRGIVAFPGTTINFDVAEDSFGSAQAAKLAAQAEAEVTVEETVADAEEIEENEENDSDVD